MRQCVFVAGSLAELRSLAPLLRRSSELRLRHTVWYAAPQDREFVNLSGELGLSSGFAQPAAPGGKGRARRSPLSQIANYYHCFRYVASIRTWTSKSPLVIVQGYGVQTWLTVMVSRWGGAQVVHVHNALDAEPARSLTRAILNHRILRNARYALCPDGPAAELSDRYPGCIVVNTGDANRQIPLAVDALLRWTGRSATS